MAEEKKKEDKVGQLRETFLKTGMQITLIAATRWVRTSIIIMFAIILAWLIYSRAFKPMREEVPLPKSVSSGSPEVNIQMLRDINKMRSGRSEYAASDFSVLDRIIVLIEKEADDK